MKKLVILLFSLFLISGFEAQSQTADVKIKDIPANAGDEGTTITIGKKGKNSTTSEFQITEGSDELNGDAAPLLKDARNNWKKACEDWKKELKELNSGNQIITMNCGKMDCVTAAMETTCKSNTTHKIRVKIN